MKLAKTVAIVACAGLLSAAAMGSARHAYAQDAEQSDSQSGSWGAPGAGAPDAAAEPDSKGPPLDVEGCWSGVVTDKGDGEGDAYFAFTQDGNKIVGDEESGLYVVWPDNAFADGPISGTVTKNGIKFKGNAGAGCPFSGTAKGNGSELTGKITFKQQCGKFLKHVRFIVESNGTCP
jgi:hypothetical protein